MPRFRTLDRKFNRESEFLTVMKRILLARVDNKSSLIPITYRDLWYKTKRENKGKAPSYRTFSRELDRLIIDNGLTYDELMISAEPKGLIFIDGTAYQFTEEFIEKSRNGAIAYLFVEKNGVAQALAQHYKGRGVVVVSTNGIPSFHHQRFAQQNARDGIPTFAVTDWDAGGYLVYKKFEPFGIPRISVGALLAAGGEVSSEAYTLDLGGWKSPDKMLPKSDRDQIAEFARMQGHTGKRGKLEIDAVMEDWGAEKFADSILKVLSANIPQVSIFRIEPELPSNIDEGLKSLHSAIKGYYGDIFTLELNRLASVSKLKDWDLGSAKKQALSMMPPEKADVIFRILENARREIESLK